MQRARKTFDLSTDVLIAPEMNSVDPYESGDYYFNMVSQLPAAIYTCDIDGYIKFYNKAAANLWGREPEIGKDLWCGSWKIYNVTGGDVPLDKCPMAVALKEKRAVMGEEIVVERPDGERRYVLPHPQPILNAKGVMVGAMNMLVDITESKRIQEANQKLKLYNDQLGQFAFAASHDLQEPLRKISTFASLLTEKHNEVLDDSGKDYLARINASSLRMKNLIADLLAFSRETNHKEELSPTDLNEVLDAVQSDLELMIREKEAVIICDQLPVINGIPAQLTRLFNNLIINSIKFSQKGFAPIIRISYRKTASFLEIVVRDNGIGFEQKYAEKIFELFQRLNDKQEYSGNGIGLSLCKRIVENHKGEIAAKAKKDFGTAFNIKLPVYLLVE